MLLDGVPLNHAEVLLPSIPDAFEYVAIGITDKEGRFRFTCKGSRAAAGENHVVVMEPDIPANLKSEKPAACGGTDQVPRIAGRPAVAETLFEPGGQSARRQRRGGDESS